MIRRVAAALAGTAVLIATAGCAYQESFGLPDLTPRSAAPGTPVYPSYGYGYGTGYPNVYSPGYGGMYGYGTGYPTGYGSVYGYGGPYYAAQGPHPYAYDPYPRYVIVPCADGDRDGRCDTRPPKKHRDRDQDGGVQDVDDRPARPGYRGEVPRVRDSVNREVAPDAQRRAAPVTAPVVQQPPRARPEPRRATPSEATGQRGPRAGRGRPSTTGNDVVSSSPAQEP